MPITITNMGEFADVTGRHQTYAKRNHAGQEVTGTLVVGNHVRFNTSSELADILARTGINIADTVGNFVGERYSADILSGFVNHPSNPCGFAASALPYVPTLEDRLDCQMVRGLWDFVLLESARLGLDRSDGGGVTGGGSDPKPDPAVAKLAAFKLAVSAALAIARGKIPAQSGGVPARAGRALMTALDDALLKAS